MKIGFCFFGIIMSIANSFLCIPMIQLVLMLIPNTLQENSIDMLFLISRIISIFAGVGYVAFSILFKNTIITYLKGK